ncbi:biotin synthase auxiliary protein BsaP [Luteipulveratus flavus]
MGLSSGSRPPRRHVDDAGDGTTWCGYCGQGSETVDHQRCTTMLALEPPRFCSRCGRRMKVQVVPTGWTAECSRHGVTTT